MPKLVAIGTDPRNYWERELESRQVTLGRTPTDSDWDTPWDNLISRRHAILTWREGKLNVRKDPRAINQIFVSGKPLEEFSIVVGDQFVIGKTTFELRDETPTKVVILPAPYTEFTCNSMELQQVRYTDADERIEVLAALPSVIRDAKNDDDLAHRVVAVLLEGIPRAHKAAVVKLHPSGSGSGFQLEVASSKSREQQAGSLEPSRRLVKEAIQNRRQSVVNIWKPGRQTNETPSDYTRPRSFAYDETYPDGAIDSHVAGGTLTDDGFDWAICAPLPDDPAPGWALYVTGRLTSTSQQANEAWQEGLLKSDLKFTELVADIFGALRQIRDLQRRQDRLASFLSRPVLSVLAEKDIDEVLRPREAEVTVLFCDLRGSCRFADDSQNNLAGLWDRVSAALGIMTSSIIDLDGVVGDFHGDAAMGFWGWPLSCADQVERASRAALIIRKRFAQAAQQKDNPLAGFNCGIGIANGLAYAGQLGTFDQSKITVYGPIVNLASRLESMTRHLKVPILLDESSAQRLTAGGKVHWCRSRPVARVQPFGMSTILTVSELLPPAVEAGAISENDRRNYEAAYHFFAAGKWPNARGLLQRLTHDGPSEFLKEFMDRYPNGRPEGWNGVISMDSK